MRIAAEDKTEFEVTDFWNVKKIHDDETNLKNTFPQNLCALIVAKSKDKSDANR